MSQDPENALNFECEGILSLAIDALHCKGYRVALLAAPDSDDVMTSDLLTIYRDVTINIQQSLECLFKGLVAALPKKDKPSQQNRATPNKDPHSLTIQSNRPNSSLRSQNVTEVKPTDLEIELSLDSTAVISPQAPSNSDRGLRPGRRKLRSQNISITNEDNTQCSPQAAKRNDNISNAAKKRCLGAANDKETTNNSIDISTLFNTSQHNAVRDNTLPSPSTGQRNESQSIPSNISDYVKEEPLVISQGGTIPMEAENSNTQNLLPEDYAAAELTQARLELLYDPHERKYVSKREMKVKALALYESLREKHDYPPFTCSRGWIEKVKERYGITQNSKSSDYVMFPELEKALVEWVKGEIIKNFTAADNTSTTKLFVEGLKKETYTDEQAIALCKWAYSKAKQSARRSTQEDVNNEQENNAGDKSIIGTKKSTHRNSTETSNSPKASSSEDDQETVEKEEHTETLIKIRIPRSKRPKYQSHSALRRHEIGKYAHDFSVKLVKKKFGHLNLPGATIRTWRTKYRKGLAQLKAKHGANYDPEIHENEVQAEMKCDVNRSCWPKRQDEAVKKLEEAGIEECDYYLLNNSDIATLTPSLPLQLQIRRVRNNLLERQNGACSSITHNPHTNVYNSPLKRMRINSGITAAQPIPAFTPESETRPEPRTKGYKPTSVEITEFLEKLNLHPLNILDSFFNRGQEIETLMSICPPIRMGHIDRLKVQRGYVSYVHGQYKKWFSSVQVHVDVVASVAKFLIRTFPSLCDTNCTAENPTYNNLFVRSPLGGTLYECFKTKNKNKNRWKSTPRADKRPHEDTGATTSAISTQSSADNDEPPHKSPRYENLGDCNVAQQIEDLEFAGPKRVTQILEATFKQRRRWIEDTPGCTTEEVLTRYRVLITRPKEIRLEFERMNPSHNAKKGKEYITKLMNETEGKDDFEKVSLMINSVGIKNKDRVMFNLLTKGDTNEQHKYGYIKTMVDDKTSEIFVIMPDGYSLKCKSVAAGISLATMLYSIVHIAYPSSSQAMYRFIASLHGVKEEDQPKRKGKGEAKSKTHYNPRMNDVFQRFFPQ